MDEDGEGVTEWGAEVVACWVVRVDFRFFFFKSGTDREWRMDAVDEEVEVVGLRMDCARRLLMVVVLLTSSSASSSASSGSLTVAAGSVSAAAGVSVGVVASFSFSCGSSGLSSSPWMTDRLELLVTESSFDFVVAIVVVEVRGVVVSTEDAGDVDADRLGVELDVGGEMCSEEGFGTVTGSWRLVEEDGTTDATVVLVDGVKVESNGIAVVVPCSGTKGAEAGVCIIGIGGTVAQSMGFIPVGGIIIDPIPPFE